MSATDSQTAKTVCVCVCVQGNREGGRKGRKERDSGNINSKVSRAKCK